MTTADYDPICVAMDSADSIPDDIDELRAALKAERAARREAEARAIGAEAIVAHLKFRIATLEHHRYAPSSERGRKLLDAAARRGRDQRVRGGDRQRRRCGRGGQ